jgi:hypothetical protein
MFSQLLEEPSDLLPPFIAAREPAPVFANQSGQLVALIDWRQKVLSGAVHAIDQQRLNIRTQFGEDRVIG